MVHTETTSKGLNKPNLIKLVLESEINSVIKELLTSEIRDLVTQMEKVEADVATVKNVDEKLFNQLIETAVVLGHSPVLKARVFRGSWNTYLYTQWFIGS